MVIYGLLVTSVVGLMGDFRIAYMFPLNLLFALIRVEVSLFGVLCCVLVCAWVNFTFYFVATFVGL